MLAGTVFGLSGCNDVQDMEAGGAYAPDPSIPLVFTSGTTRGTVPLDNNNIKDRHFCVSAFIAGNESFIEADNSKKKTYFKDIEYIYNIQDNIWKGNPSVYWPLDPEARLSFFAYAPVASDQIKFNGLSTDGWPSITVTPMTNVTNQPDFCVADPLIDQTRINALPLTFHHMLTKIVFAARYKGTLPSANYKVRIDKVTIKNVVGSKNLIFYVPANETDKGYKWVELSDSDGKVDYTLTYGKDNQLINSLDEGNELPNASESDDFKEIQGSDGYLYLIPQELENAKLEVTYSLYEKCSNNVEVRRTFIESSDNNLTGIWEAGHSVTYNFTLFVGASNKIEVEENVIEEWVDGNTTVNGGTIE